MRAALFSATFLIVIFYFFGSCEDPVERSAFGGEGEEAKESPSGDKD